MADEKQSRKPEENEEQYESNAARRLKALGGEDAPTEEEPVKVDRLANFWLYNKTKILIGGAFAVILIVALVQLLNKQNPDVSILYAGPDYITPNDSRALCSVIENMTGDMNGDGRSYVLLEDIVFMSDGQIEEYIEAAKADNEDAAVDTLKNAEIADRFVYEVFAGDAMLCFLAEDQYETVRDGGGFERLDGIFGEIPNGAIDEYGVRLCDTDFAKFYSSVTTDVFPKDTVIALRTIPTASALTGKKRYEKLHDCAERAMKAIVRFEFPEGYEEK